MFSPARASEAALVTRHACAASSHSRLNKEILSDFDGEEDAFFYPDNLLEGNCDWGMSGLRALSPLLTNKRPERHLCKRVL